MRTRHRAFCFIAVCLVWMALAVNPLFALEETGGIGMTVAQLYNEISEDHRGYIVVLDVFKDGPAYNGGVERGDIITHINDRMTKARELNDILKMTSAEPKERTLRCAYGATARKSDWKSS